MALFGVLGTEVALVAAQSPPWSLADYHTSSDFLPQTPSVSAGAVGAFANPAAWAMTDRAELAFWWDDQNLRPDALDNWGYSFGKNLGFAANSRTFWVDGQDRRITDLQVGLAGGDRRATVGFAYRWARGDRAYIPRENALVVGAIGRPSRFYSYGLAGTFSTRTSARIGVFDLGIRPLGSDWLTVFGDYSLREKEGLGEGSWGAGVEVRPVPGLHLGVKFHDVDFEDEYRYTLNVGVTLAGLGFHVLPGYNEAGDNQRITYLLRSQPSYRSLPVDINPFPQPAHYVPINLENKRISYQKYRWWDKKRVAWLDLVQYLRAIGKDPDVQGIALNLAGARMRPSLAWELRQELASLQAAGKELLVHTDDVDMLGAYVASVADRWTCDPQALVMLPGAAMKRTYVKGTLEKLGIGVQEFRYFTHKSAFETFARKGMSDADREQRARVIDVIYETLREGICQGRGLSAAQFDAIVDDDVLLTPRLAADRGLVDASARWRDLEKWLAAERNGRLKPLSLEPHLRRYRDVIWGEPPHIAVVYAVGSCEMDSGIKGRATSEHMRKLARDPQVAAVVLRVDSPGGFSLPSDLVAEATSILKEAGKPVVVSQGDVAASGGYWISMNGSRIVTTPLTLTGSIGVIAGWLWDDGLGEKTGLSAEGVQRGKHADLFQGLRLPLLDLDLPQRPLDAEELGHVKDLMLDLYTEFVDAVARGRKLDADRVRQIGEGRVWMGGDAIERGLCDRHGTLADAITLAGQLAGLSPDQQVTLVEYPERPLFELPAFGPDLPGALTFLSPIMRPLVTIWQRLRGQPEAAAELALLARAWAFAEETARSQPALDAALAAGALAELQDRGDGASYLELLAGAGGKPAVLLSPDELPEAWQESW